jgi:hypothetical protein
MDKKTLREMSGLSARLMEDRMCKPAVNEIESNAFDAVAKAKAFEDAEGDKQKARTFYTKHRVRRIKDELEFFLVELEQEQNKQRPRGKRTG